MSEINVRFSRFIKAIGPTEGQNKVVKAELDFLETKLKNYVADDDDTTFVKALRSGSYAKATLLRRHEQGDFDADIAIYVRGGIADEDHSDGLLDYLERLLRRAYKNRSKRKPRFDRSSKSAVKVIFDDHPKINIDAVPVITVDHDQIPNYGEIPRRDGERRRTSVTEHILFVQQRSSLYQPTPFHNLIRIWKWWRNHAFDEHDRVSSFFLELLLGQAFDESLSGFSDQWLDNLLAAGTWIVRHRLADPVIFDDSRVPPATAPHSAEVVVVDPMNADNNITHDWTAVDRDGFLEKVGEFCDVLQDAINDAEAGEHDDAAEILEQALPRFLDFSQED